MASVDAAITAIHSPNLVDENENQTMSTSIVKNEADLDANRECDELSAKTGHAPSKRGRRRKLAANDDQPAVKTEAIGESGETETKRVRYSFRARPEPALNPQLVEMILEQGANKQADGATELQSTAKLSAVNNRRNSVARQRESLSTSVNGDHASVNLQDSVANTEAALKSPGEPETTANASKNVGGSALCESGSKAKTARGRNSTKKSLKSIPNANDSSLADSANLERRKRPRKTKQAANSDDYDAPRRFAFAGDSIRDLLPVHFVQQWHTRRAISEAKEMIDVLESRVATNHRRRLASADSSSPAGEKLAKIVDWLSNSRTASSVKLETNAKHQAPQVFDIMSHGLLSVPAAIVVLPHVEAPEVNGRGISKLNSGKVRAVWRSEKVQTGRAFLDAFGLAEHSPVSELEAFTLVEHGVKIWPTKKQAEPTPTARKSETRKYKRKSIM